MAGDDECGRDYDHPDDTEWFFYVMNWVIGLEPESDMKAFEVTVPDGPPTP